MRRATAAATSAPTSLGCLAGRAVWVRQSGALPALVSAQFATVTTASACAAAPWRVMTCTATGGSRGTQSCTDGAARARPASVHGVHTRAKSTNRRVRHPRRPVMALSIVPASSACW
eukprot:7905668-Alexandrium_andersonii.AAC.1